jgi:CdiI immunity protein
VNPKGDDTRESESAPDRSVDWAEQLPNLYGLLGGSLFESWSSVHDSPAAALREGIDDRSLADLRATLAELDQLRAQHLGEKELDRILFYELRSYYNAVDQTYSEWLDEVAAQLMEAVRSRESYAESVDSEGPSC